MSFHTYIKAVGTGPKGNRDLSLQESKDVMCAILERSAYDEQIAAFLLGWRLKPETIEEFQGALEACDAFIKKQEVSNSIELGYPFDGKAKNPYLFPLIAKSLQNTDLNLVLYGDDLQPAKDGITIKQINENIEFASNIKYFDRKNFFPQLHKLTELRLKLGLRTGFNTIEKLPNVAKSEFAITGVFHTPYVKKYMEIFAPRYKRFALVKGNEGGPEMFSKGSLWISQNDVIEEFEIDPNRYGINIQKATEKISLETSLDLLKNPSKDLLQLAKLNAAIYMFVAKKANSIDEAYDYLV